MVVVIKADISQRICNQRLLLKSKTKIKVSTKGVNPKHFFYYKILNEVDESTKLGRKAGYFSFGENFSGFFCFRCYGRKRKCHNNYSFQQTAEKCSKMRFKFF